MATLGDTTATKLTVAGEIKSGATITAPTFTGNLTGKSTTSGTADIALKLGSGGSASTPMTFTWSGQSGQPSWVFGGNAAANVYVYNPSNFSVNYATSSGSCSGNSATATKLATARSLWGNNFDGTANINGSITGNSSATVSGFAKVINAVYNDYADMIFANIEPEPGRCYVFDGKKYRKSNEYCEKGIIGIHSDTFSFLAGGKCAHKELVEKSLAISIGGFVLAHVDKVYESGTPLTCDKDGTLTKIKLKDRILHPERIVGTFWKPELDKVWHDVLVNGRHWIKIK